MKKLDEKQLLSDMLGRLDMLKDDCIAVLAPMHVRYNDLRYGVEEGETGEKLLKEQINQIGNRIDQVEDAQRSIESAMTLLTAVMAPGI